jgi:Fic family protein
MAVRQHGHYEQWIAFFLRGIIESAQHALDTIDLLLSLHAKNQARLHQIKGKRKVTALHLFHHIESHPILDIPTTCEATGLSFNAVAGAIEQFVQLGILTQIRGRERYRVFAYSDYLDILRNGTEL